MLIRYFADIRFPLERANGVQTMETCHALARRGHLVHLVVRRDSADPPRDPFAYYGLPSHPLLSVERLRVPAGEAPRRAMFIAKSLRRVTGIPRADAILTRDLAFAALLVRLPRPWRSPVVYESHGYAPAVAEDLPAMVSGAAPLSTAKRRRLEARERLVWAAADGYVTITAALARELEDRFGARTRLAVIPDGARLAPIDGTGLRARADGEAPVVAYAGHLYPWKGADVLVEAVARLPEVRAVVVGGMPGEPDLPRVCALADRIAPGRVRFTGLVEPPRVPALLRDADVLVVPNTPGRASASYTSPLKLFEYMASGRPIVASDLPALGEVLRRDENAVLVEAGNAEALAAALARVLGDAPLAARLAAQAREDASGWTWDARARRLEALLDAVAGGAA
ncbi:MAG TPA: glycosyltransferase family 4 protein [Vicinamibacterales bacterium]|nr:glycosyltransferase family 4 protein [Vicinamibacterales bacterium]HOQ59578.1 glycosyltransferase family 4 protein [Vicinamibacterales bacterium]HPK72492.1 glycosyltransferase family 4 protein [Vicinamibacterales bacterium]